MIIAIAITLFAIPVVIVGFAIGVEQLGDLLETARAEPWVDYGDDVAWAAETVCERDFALWEYQLAR